MTFSAVEHRGGSSTVSANRLTKLLRRPKSSLPNCSFLFQTEDRVSRGVLPTEDLSVPVPATRDSRGEYFQFRHFEKKKVRIENDRNQLEVSRRFGKNFVDLIERFLSKPEQKNSIEFLPVRKQRRIRATDDSVSAKCSSFTINRGSRSFRYNILK